jgi:hypothetical protein
MADLVCWNCGASLKHELLPLSRRAVCAACEVELHVCRLCQFYDRLVSDQCTEDRAEQVREKDRANFCDYFKPKAGAYVASGDSKARTARDRLEGLFGATAGESATTEDVQQKWERLFAAREKKDK